jgi:hypothetical protein
MVKGDVYGVWAKSYEPWTDDSALNAKNDLEKELYEGLDNVDDYEVEFISKHYYEDGAIPVWTMAIKATRKVK